MRLPALDERLHLAAKLFPACEWGADIGADHGRLSCYLLANNICTNMAVTDISEPSLAKAKRLLSLHGLSERAEFSVGDGLDALTRPVQAIAILGMGGTTLAGILRRGENALHGAALVLSAQTDLPLVRQTLCDIHYTVECEEISFCAGRYYVLCRAVPGECRLTEKELFLGPGLMKQTGHEYAAYASWRYDVTLCEKNAEAAIKLNWLKEELERVGYSTNH